MKNWHVFDALSENEVECMTERGHSEKMEYKKEMGAQAAFCAPNVRFFQHPMREIAGYHTCQGYCLQNGAYELPNGVNFTISSMGATSVSLLLFYRRAQKPFAVLPFPEEYRVGNVYSMIVFGLDIGEFEYAYSIDGPNDPARGMLFDPNNIILDPYARAVAGQSKWGTKAIPGSYRGRIVSSYFNWENVQSPHIPMQDLVIYEIGRASCRERV